MSLEDRVREVVVEMCVGCNRYEGPTLRVDDIKRIKLVREDYICEPCYDKYTVLYHKYKQTKKVEDK